MNNNELEALYDKVKNKTASRSEELQLLDLLYDEKQIPQENYKKNKDKLEKNIDVDVVVAFILVIAGLFLAIKILSDNK